MIELAPGASMFVVRAVAPLLYILRFSSQHSMYMKPVFFLG